MAQERNGPLTLLRHDQDDREEQEAEHQPLRTVRTRHRISGPFTLLPVMLRLYFAIENARRREHRQENRSLPRHPKTRTGPDTATRPIVCNQAATEFYKKQKRLCLIINVYRKKLIASKRVPPSCCVRTCWHAPAQQA